MSHRDDRDPAWPFRPDAKLSPRLQRIKEQREREREFRIVHLTTWDYARAVWAILLRRLR